MEFTDVYTNLSFDEALSATDDKYVLTIKGRGKTYFDDFYGSLNVSKITKKFKGAKPVSVKTILCGHRGCGKSTELNRLAAELDADELFYVIKIDASAKLNLSDVQFVDVFMALANKLFNKIQKENIKIDKKFLKKLENWFSTKIVSEDFRKESSLEHKAGGEINVSFFVKLFTSFTTAFKNSSTYSNEIRRQIQNSFNEFAKLLINSLIMLCSN